MDDSRQFGDEPARMSNIPIPSEMVSNRVEELTYDGAQVCAAIKISATTLWRLEKRGRLKSLPGLRHKRYSIAGVRRFVERSCQA